MTRRRRVFLHGTSGWSYKDWVGPFYAPGTADRDFLSRYAERFGAVEVDSTFYRTPSTRTTESWNRATPEGFVFVPKMVREVTHERFLEDADKESERFLEALQPLGKKLGPVILQFPYSRKAEGVTLDAFLGRLLPYLDGAPEGARFAVEVRNKTFLKPPLFKALRDRATPLVLNDHPWMPRPEAWASMPGAFTSDRVVIRLLGDRKAIETVTKTWGATVVDREGVLAAWAGVIANALEEGRSVAAFVNNHFSGFAPDASLRLAELVDRRVRGALGGGTSEPS